MSDIPEKKYPAAPTEISRVMGLSQNEDEELVSDAELPTGNLPIVEHSSAHGIRHAAVPTHVEPGIHEKIDAQVVPDFEKSGWSPATVVKLIAPYAAIFLLGIFLYFFFFTKFDFYSLFKSSTTVKQSTQDSALQQLEKQNLGAYSAWIHTYYYEVTDSAILDPEADNSGNGLSNFQKFLLDLNPKSYDTIGLGMADSEALAKGINPLSGLKMNDTQKNIVDKYFDLETIQNKLTLYKMNGGSHGLVAGATINGMQNSSTSTIPSSNGDPQPINGAVKSNSQTAGQASTIDYQANPAAEILAANLDIDMSKPGRLEVPAVGINVPLIWSTDPKNFDNDLKNGVIHYPGTALPGQIGTSYISGHSSNYVWVKGSYNRIFAKLNDVPNDSSFKITVVQKNGKDAVLHYVVTGRKEFQPNDIAQFTNVGKSVVALSTCWPVNTTQKRLLLYGELTQVEQ